MYTDFGDSVKLDLFLSEYYEDFKSHKNAARLIKVFIELKKKLCITYTGEHFHCSNGGMSRDKDVMSRLKGRGLLKDQMKKWTLWEFQRHYSSLEKSYKHRAIEAIKFYILKDNYCSAYAKKKMDEAMYASGDYKLIPKKGTKKKLFEESYDDTRNLHGRT